MLNYACLFAPRGIGLAALEEASGPVVRGGFRDALADVVSYCLAVRDPHDRYNVHELIGEYVRFLTMVQTAQDLAL